MGIFVVAFVRVRVCKNKLNIMLSAALLFPFIQYVT